MSAEQYYLHRDSKGRFLLQALDTGLLAGLLFPGSPGESAHAFSYNFGSVWYPNQLINLTDFPELANMPFFTIESCGFYELEQYFQQEESSPLCAFLGSSAKFASFSPNLKQIPSHTQEHTKLIVWQYQVPNPNGSWTIPILGLWVNEQGCWFCTREGQVFVTNHQGELIQQYDLPKLTRCLAGYADAPYASCDDGNLYDLTAKLPYPIYRMRPANDYSYMYQILALVQTAEAVLVADAYGHLQVLTDDLELLWQQHHSDHWLSYFLANDAKTTYLGHYQGLNTYDLLTGEEQWGYSLSTSVLCGGLTPQEVLVGCSDRKIYGLSKLADPQTGEPSIRLIYTCTGIPYTLLVLAESQSFLVGDYTGKIEQIDWGGNVQSTIQTLAGAITALGVWGDRLYATTSRGVLICLKLAA